MRVPEMNPNTSIIVMLIRYRYKRDHIKIAFENCTSQIRILVHDQTPSR